MDQGDEFWWRNGIFYQIYPRSFQDSNADGVGDIAGIVDRLPYLQALGIDAVWLSPIFPSPMADFGYDISDYTGIDPLFGTMDDFDALVAPRMAAVSRSFSISFPTIPPTSIPGSSKAAAPAKIPSATGTSGAIRGRRRAAEQLAVGIRRQRLDFRCRDRAILLSRFPRPAAGSELAQPRRSRGDLRGRCGSGCARASTVFAST